MRIRPYTAVSVSLFHDTVGVRFYDQCVFVPWSVKQSTGWKIKTYHLQTGVILTEISTHLTHKCPPPPNDVWTIQPLIIYKLLLQVDGNS